MCIWAQGRDIWWAVVNTVTNPRVSYRSADKSLARPGRKQARKHVREARDFNNIETLAVIKFFFLQGKAPKEIHAILRETLSLFPSWSGQELISTPVKRGEDFV